MIKMDLLYENPLFEKRGFFVLIASLADLKVVLQKALYIRLFGVSQTKIPSARRGRRLDVPSYNIVKITPPKYACGCVPAGHIIFEFS